VEPFSQSEENADVEDFDGYCWAYSVTWLMLMHAASLGFSRGRMDGLRAAKKEVAKRYALYTSKKQALVNAKAGGAAATTLVIDHMFEHSGIQIEGVGSGKSRNVRAAKGAHGGWVVSDMKKRAPILEHVCQPGAALLSWQRPKGAGGNHATAIFCDQNPMNISYFDPNSGEWWARGSGDLDDFMGRYIKQGGWTSLQAVRVQREFRQVSPGVGRGNPVMGTGRSPRGK